MLYPIAPPRRQVQSQSSWRLGADGRASRRPCKCETKSPRQRTGRAELPLEFRSSPIAVLRPESHPSFEGSIARPKEPRAAGPAGLKRRKAPRPKPGRPGQRGAECEAALPTRWRPGIPLQLVDPALHPLDRVAGRVEVVEPLPVLVGQALEIGVAGPLCGLDLLVLPAWDCLLGDRVDIALDALDLAVGQALEIVPALRNDVEARIEVLA